MQRSWVAAALVALILLTTGGGVLGADPGEEAPRTTGWTGYAQSVVLPYTTVIESVDDNVGWIMFKVRVPHDMRYQASFTATGTVADARTFYHAFGGIGAAEERLIQFGGGPSGSAVDTSCRAVRGETHLDDCPLQTIKVDGRGGGGMGTLKAGDHIRFAAHYGGEVGFRYEISTEGPIEILWVAEGASRLVPVTPAYGSVPGPAAGHAMFFTDQPFIAAFRGQDAYHAESVTLTGPDGAMAIDRFSMFNPFGLPGRAGMWTVQAQGTLADSEPTGALLVGLLLGTPLVQGNGTIVPFGEVDHDPPMPSMMSASPT